MSTERGGYRISLGGGGGGASIDSYTTHVAKFCVRRDQKF